MKNIKNEVQNFLNLIAEIEKDSKENQDFTHSIPEDFYYIELKPPKHEQLVYLNKPIKILRLGISKGLEVYLDSKSAYTTRKYFLYFLFEDYTNLVKFNIDATSLDKLMGLGNRKWKCRGEIGAFSDRFITPVDWEKKSVNEIYVDDTIRHYRKAYLKTIPVLIRKIQREAAHGLYIFDGGCGNGDFGELFSQSLPTNLDLSRVHYLGFDFKQENIDRCLEKHIHSRLGSFQFITGNLLNIHQIIRDRVQDQKSTLVIFSGSLTRNVLRNAFQALLVLQRTAESNVRYLIGGGFEQPMVTDFIARKLGYRNTWPKEKFGHFFLYKKLSAKTILKNKTHKLAREGILDLSLSYRPEFILDKLQHKVRSGTIIDLSFCVLSDPLLNKLIELRRLYNIKIIFWHFDPKVIAQFEDRFGFFTEFKGVNVSIHLVKDDIYLMAPKKFFTAVNPQHELIKETKFFMESRFDEKVPADDKIKIEIERFVDGRTKNNIQLPELHAKQYLKILITRFSDTRQRIIENFLTLPKLSAENMFALIKIIRLLDPADFPEIRLTSLTTYIMSKRERICSRLLVTKRSSDTISLYDDFSTELLCCVKIDEIYENLCQEVTDHPHISLFRQSLIKSIERTLQDPGLMINSAYSAILTAYNYFIDIIQLKEQVNSLVKNDESKDDKNNLHGIVKRSNAIQFLKDKFNDLCLQVGAKLEYYHTVAIDKDSAYSWVVVVYGAVTRLDALIEKIFDRDDPNEAMRLLCEDVINAYSQVTKIGKSAEKVDELINSLTQRYDSCKPNLSIEMDDYEEKSSVMGRKDIFEKDYVSSDEEMPEEEVMEEGQAATETDTQNTSAITGPPSPVTELIQLNIFTTSNSSAGTASSQSTTSHYPHQT